MTGSYLFPDGRAGGQPPEHGRLAELRPRQRQQKPARLLCAAVQKETVRACIPNCGPTAFWTP